MKKLGLLMLTLFMAVNIKAGQFDYLYQNNQTQTDNSYQMKYNYYNNKWQYVPQSYKLQYNYMSGKWEYVPVNSQPKYNYMENEWQMVPNQ